MAFEVNSEWRSCPLGTDILDWHLGLANFSPTLLCSLALFNLKMDWNAWLYRMKMLTVVL